MAEKLVHSTAIIDYGAIIGVNTRIWHFSHVCSFARIGDNCSLGQNVFIGSQVTIGNGCKIQNNVSVFDRVRLEDNVFCGPSVVFTNVLNPRAAISKKNEYLDTIVKKGVTLGANSTIVCGVTIGEYAFIAAGAVIIADVKAYALMAGVPAKQIGWRDKEGNPLQLPIESLIKTEITQSGVTYILENGLCYAK